MAADTLRAALVQLSVSDDPAANLPVTLDLVRQAAASGARLVCTPEVTNLLT
ncbi:MAG: nitrilase-related carbon-nitrogen hydrolase, partial [Pseudomonadota bacterium]